MLVIILHAAVKHKPITKRLALFSTQYKINIKNNTPVI